jgi:hypothetical protein
MAATSVKVPCPDCGEKIEIPLEVRTESMDTTGPDAELRVCFAPSITPMVEHYVAEHVGADLEP